MALNRERVGTSYPPYPYEVSREKIREYAAAIGETDPRYFSDGDDCVAPPTFAACFTIVKGAQPLFADPDLGTHPALVHGAQRYRFGDRPLAPGDVLSCTPRVAEISARGGNEFLSIEVDCRFRDTDELAVLSEATIVFLGSARSAAATADADRAGARGGPVAPEEPSDDADEAAAAATADQEGAA